jgi:hypothetical protein
MNIDKPQDNLAERHPSDEVPHAGHNGRSARPTTDDLMRHMTYQLGEDPSDSQKYIRHEQLVQAGIFVGIIVAIALVLLCVLLMI